MHTTTTTNVRRLTVGLTTALASLVLLTGPGTQPASALRPDLDGVCTCHQDQQIDQVVAARKAEMARDRIDRGLLAHGG